jgi:CxxC-x17-CxxC domain-containing protein
MDDKKILIMNLSKGRIGEDSSRLLGALLVTKLQLAAMSRVDTAEKERNDFILYIDEFQNFSTDSFANILSEARKYRLSLVLAHQYINQMEEKVRDAVFGNVGTMIVFRVGAEDGEFLEKEFSPEFFAHDLVNLPKQNIYVKLMIDGVTSRPFSAETLPPAISDFDYEKDIIEFSRNKYGTSRNIVEEKISKYAGVENISKIEFKEQRQTELFDAQCEKCKKKVKVPFKPDGKRPVYCKSCLSSKNEEAPKSTFEKIPYISLEEKRKKKGKRGKAGDG